MMAGIFDYLNSTVQSPMFLAGAGLLSGEGFGGAMQGMQMGQRNQALQRQQAQEQQRQQAFEGLFSDPNMLKGVPMGAVNIARAAGPEAGLPMLAGMLPKPRDPLDERYKLAQIKNLEQQASGGAQFGKQGTIIQDRNGNFYSVQFGSNGQQHVQPLQLGDQALQPSRGVETVGDTIRDKATGRVVENIGQNLAGAERAKGIGEAQGKAIAAAPGDISSADTALELIASIRNDPSRQQGTGFSSVFNRVPGTAGYDFQRKNDQATSGAFLTAIQQLRGMGALSNAEGQTATAAVNRMNTSQTEKGYIEALADYERLVQKGRSQAMARLQGGGNAMQMPQQQNAPAQQRPDPLGLFGGN